MNKIIRDNPLFWAFFVPAAIDGTLTLIGQSPDYWQNYKLVNEGSPAFIILAIHPGLFITGGILWFVFWYLVYKRLKEPWNIMLTIGFIAGHAYGASSWLTKIMGESGLYGYGNRIGWYLLILYFVFLDLVCGGLIRYYFQNKRVRE